jgi:uncharacterized protein (DUF779 family)
MCYPRGDLLIGDGDRLLGEIGGQPFYIGLAQLRPKKARWRCASSRQGCGGMFSLEGVEGVRFLTRSRIFTDEENGALAAAEGPAPGLRF